MSAVSPIRVLLAESDASARALLGDLLRSLGHEVVGEVGTGRDAVRCALDAHPDAVLLDVQMPDGSGIAAAEEITHAMPDVAVALYTGDYDLSLTDHEIASTAAVALLPKSAPAVVLDSTIRLAVSRARQLSAARRDADEARQQLENRKLIERAKGLLMRRTGTSEQEAYRILQRSSQDRAVPMVDIARAVLESEPGAIRVEAGRSSA